MRSLRATVLLLVAFAITIAVSFSQVLTADELRAFDALGKLRGARAHSPWPANFATIRVDGRAADRYGRWPWPRSLTARFLDRLNALGTRTVVLDFYAHGATTIDADTAYRGSLTRGNVVLGIEVGSGLAASNGEFARRLIPVDVREPTVAASNIAPPEESFLRAAAGAGHTWFPIEPDGSVRSQPPLMGVSPGKSIPSLALAGVLADEHLDPAGLRWTPRKLTLPDGKVLSMVHGRQPLDLWNPSDTPPSISAAEVLDTAHEPSLSLRGKMVLVYLDDPGIDRKMFASHYEVPGGMLSAYAIRSILAGSPYRVVTFLWVAPLLVALGLLLAFLPGGPAATGRRVSYALLGWLLLASAAFLFSHTMLPLLAPILFFSIVGIGTVASRAQTVAARADAGKAPRGKVALVFTDVQSSTRMWNKAPETMRGALALHNAAIRSSLGSAGGYEVKTEGDAFMLVFRDVVSAARWCLEMQQTLLDASWSPSLLALPEAAEIRDERGTIVFRGLRVRMGIHVGEPEAHVDPLTGRMDYLGPAVNLAARVAGAARGGQIFVSAAAWAELEGAVGALPPSVSRDAGEVALKGFPVPERLTELLPRDLARRYADVTSRA